MRTLFFICLILGFYSSIAFAQTSDEEGEIEAAIVKLFNGMRNSDSLSVRSVFADEAELKTIATDQAGNTVVRSVELNTFLSAVGSEKQEVWDERIHEYDIRRDGPLASVFTPYSFYRGDTFSHCGTNSFQMVKTSGEWKIWFLIDTRRQTGCQD